MLLWRSSSENVRKTLPLEILNFMKKYILTNSKLIRNSHGLRGHLFKGRARCFPGYI